MSESLLEELADATDFETEEPLSVPSPREIKAYLDRFVVGQERAKKVLAVAAWNHVKRINDRSGLIRKSNILMVGPSGCGKTLLVETLAGLLKLPMVTADATSLTESGYSGNNVESILTALLKKAGGDLERAERGIVFVDEIDKLACRGANQQREAYCRGVQQGLLKIVEGGLISTPVSLESKNRRIPIDTSNILFICGGAFQGLGEERRSVPEARPIGFRAAETVLPTDRRESSGRRILPEQLVEYGLTQEFIGRFPVLVRLDPLSEADMVRVISETDNCLIREYSELLARDGVELKFAPGAVQALAAFALRKKTGARGLRSVMEELLTELMFKAPDEGRGQKEFTVTEADMAFL